MRNAIVSQLPEDFPWKEHFLWFDTIDSTNTRGKALAAEGAPQGTILAAGQQTGGRGRMGRSFHSPEGLGIYLSVILRPRCHAEALLHLTCATAVAICDAVETAAGFRPGIKWTNDLVFAGRKLGGILTELSLGADGTVEYAILGIGINCLQRTEDFPPELQGFAGSLSMAAGKAVPPDRLAAAILTALYALADTLFTRDWIAQYRKDCITLGKEISLVRGEDIRHGTALTVDAKGGLTVAFSDGHTETVNSGEVSIRGMYGYL